MHLDEFLTVIRTHLNNYLNETNQTSGTEYVKILPIKNQAGELNQIDDSIAMFPLRMDQEWGVQYNSPTMETLSDGTVRKHKPAKMYHVFIFFAPLYSEYLQSLKFSSQIANFFSLHPILTQDHYPGLTETSTGFHALYVNQSTDVQNQLWGMLGTSMQYGVLYKMTTRLGEPPATIDEPAVKEPVTAGMKRI